MLVASTLVWACAKPGATLWRRIPPTAGDTARLAAWLAEQRSQCEGKLVLGLVRWPAIDSTTRETTQQTLLESVECTRP